MMMTAPACAQETIPVVLDSVKTDTVVKSAPRKLGLIRRIIRGFDKVDERYIEPQHYVYAAMLQGTRNYDYYTLRSAGDNRQSISFSPDWTAGNMFSFHAAGFNADIQTLIVSRQYLSNDEDPNATLKTYSVTNLMMTYALPFHKLSNARNIPDITLKCQLNNIFNAKYVNNGGTDGTYVWYFPQAGINVHAGFAVRW